jgi:flagellar FliL protein
MAAKAQAPTGAAGQVPAKGGRKKLLLLAGVAVLLLGGGGGGVAYFLGLFGGGGGKAEAAADPHGGDAHHGDAPAEAADGHAEEHGDAGSGHAGEDGKAANVVFVDLPDLLVNLRSDSKRMRFLKLRVALEVESSAAGDGVKALTPRVMDSFQMYLRALSVDEIQGSAGMQKLTVYPSHASTVTTR